jgi:hypothetical protein
MVIGTIPTSIKALLIVGTASSRLGGEKQFVGFKLGGN